MFFSISILFLFLQLVKSLDVEATSNIALTFDSNATENNQWTLDDGTIACATVKFILYIFKQQFFYFNII